jgi:hypothetical protein
MKRLEKALAVGGLVLSISLMGLGLYRDNKFPEEYWRNTLAKGAGLICLSASAGIALRRPVEEYIRGEREYL